MQVIEQQMSGVDHLLYLSATSDDSGQSTITLTFEPGTDPDIAQVQVQNKLQLAVPLLPPQVQQSGIRVTQVGRGVPAGRRRSSRPTRTCRSTTSPTTSSRTCRIR